MVEFLLSLPYGVSIAIAAGTGIAAGALFSWFGEIVSPDDIV